MIIKDKIRKALLEATKNKTHKNEFGCLMVGLDVADNKWEEILDLIDKEDLYLVEDDDSYGKEHEPHVTILFGFHSDILDKDIEPEIKNISKPDIKFGGVSSFSNDMFDVLKFDIISEDLHTLNEKFKEFPHTNKFKDYHPHATIAYLKPKKAQKYIKIVNDFIEKNGKIKVGIDDLIYSKTNGDKKRYSLN